MKIRDCRTDEGKKERDTQKEADLLASYMLIILDADYKPGAWIKKHGKKFKHLSDLKPEHFQHEMAAKFLRHSKDCKCKECNDKRLKREFEKKVLKK